MSKLLRQIVTSGTKKKSGKKKTIRIALDIEYYEKIQLFCERYNRKLNETLKGVLEEFVDEIEKNDPLYHTLISSKSKGDDSPLVNQGKKENEENNVENKVADEKEKEPEKKNKNTEPLPEKPLSKILIETVKK